MKHTLLLLILIILLASCLSIEEHVSLKKDGSGTLTIEYILAEEFASFGRLGDDENVFPVPVERARFVEGADAIEGIRFKSYSSKLKNGFQIIVGSVRFDSVSALSEFMFGHSGSVTLSNSANTSTLTFVFNTEGVAEMNQDAEDMIKEFLGDETVSMTVRAPETITSVSQGSFSGRNAEITLGIPELVLNETFSWVVSWK